MGVLKNDVGRPSNKTIMTRNVLKTILLIIIAGAVFASGYLLNDYQNQNNKQSKKNNKMETSLTKESQEKNKFDVSKVTTSKQEDNEYGINIYIDEKKLNLHAPVIKLNSVKAFEEIGVLELTAEDIKILVFVNNNGEILYSTNDENYGVYCDSYSLEECYGYKIKEDEITYYMTNMFHGGEDFVCDSKQNNEVLKEYKITYKDGKLSKPKKISSMSSKEYAQKHNVNCQ